MCYCVCGEIENFQKSILWCGEIKEFRKLFLGVERFKVAENYSRMWRVLKLLKSLASVKCYRLCILWIIMLGHVSIFFTQTFMGTKIFICGFEIFDGGHGKSLLRGVKVSPWGGVYCKKCVIIQANIGRIWMKIW